MLIKTQLLLILIAFTFFGINAQKLEIDWGKDFDSKLDVQKILGITDGKLVTFDVKGKKRFISTFKDGDYALLSSSEFSLPELEGKKSGLLNAVVTGDHVTLILHVYIKKTRSFHLYGQEISLQGKMIGKPVKLYSSAEVEEKVRDAEVDMRFTPDGKQAMIYFKRMDKKEFNYLSDVVILNIEDKLELVSTSAYEFPLRTVNSEKMDTQLIHSIENDGTFSIILEKRELEKGKVVDFSLFLHGYDKNGKKIGEGDLSVEGKILSGPNLIKQDEGYLIVGYYTNSAKGKNFVNGYSGLFTANVDSKYNVKNISTESFSDEFLSNLYSTKKIDKSNEKGKELLVPVGYTMNEIYLHPDNSLSILSEYYTKVVYVGDKGQKTTVTTNGSILVFKLNPQGKIKNADVINKMQVSKTTSISLGAFTGGLSIFISIELPDNRAKYWGYKSLSSNGKIYLVFNDHFKNMSDSEDDISRALTNPKKSIPYLVTIESDGTFKKEAMIDSGDTETYLIPAVAYKIAGKSEFIIWGVWRKLNKFGKGVIN